MRRIKRALSLKGKGADESLSELAEQMSIEVNGKDNGKQRSNFAYIFIHGCFCHAMLRLAANIYNRCT